MIHTYNILIVEDDQQVQVLYQHILPENYHFFFAENIAGAQHHLGSTAMDCIILDISLNDEDGLSIARSIRQEHKNLILPILVVTARAFPKDREMALAAGGNDYLSKPFNQTQLRMKVADLLALRK